MTTIRVTSRNAAGVAVPGARVVVRLVAGPRPTDPGYFLTGDYSITSESHTVTGSTGLKVLTLPPTDGISPDGCFYEIATVTGTNVAKRTIIVPDSGTYDWGDPAIQVITPVPPEWEPIVVEPWKYVGEAGEIPFDDGWGNDPSLSGIIFSTLRYRLEGDVVRVEGCVSGGTPDPTGVTGVATLPAGYRPAFVTIGGAISIDPTDFSLGAAVLGINPGGTLSVASAAESAVLYSATFVAV